MSEIRKIARPTEKAIREMSAREMKTKRGIVDAYINIDSGECEGIFWKNDGYSWFENTPKNTYPVHIPARTEIDDWDEDLKYEIDAAIDLLKQKIESQEE